MKKKYIKYAVIAAIIIAVSGWGLNNFYFNKKAKASNAEQFSEVEVVRGDIKETASGTGNIESSIRKEIMSLNSGIVEKIYIEEGQEIKEGELILTFENDNENSIIQKANLNVTMAENDLKELEEDLKNLKVYAPSSGIVGDISLNIGEELSKGYLLTTITEKSTMEVVGLFNKTQIKSINVEDEAEIIIPGSYEPINGKVINISGAPGDHAGAVLYDVIIEVNNPGGLTSGMNVQVTVKNDNGSYPSVETSETRTKKPYDVKLLTGGTLAKLYVTSGDCVEKGELLAELNSNDLNMQIENQEIRLEQSKLELSEKLEDLDDTAIYAPISGTVTNINVTESEQVRENVVIAVVSDLDNLEIIIPVDELDISDVRSGQEAVVSVSAVPDTIYSAEVTKIALEGTQTGGVCTFDVTLSLNESKNLKSGMTANTEIISSSKSDALILPIEAVQMQGNKKFVFTGNIGDFEMVSVNIGLVSESYVEITKGLKEGDTVYYPLAVRDNLEDGNKAMGMKMMGGMGGNKPPIDKKR